MYGKALILGAGLAIGFVLGARQGRPAYDRIADRARSVWRNPRVQQTVGDASDAIRDKVPVIGTPIADAIDES